MSLDPKQIAVWREQASVAAELLPAQIGADSLGGRYAVALAREAVPTLVAEVEAQRAVLREVEWGGASVLTTLGSGPLPTCPRCHNTTAAGHADDCRLTALLPKP